MLGLIVALHAVLTAEQSARNIDTEPWSIETPAIRNIGLSLAATHDWALSRIKASARGARELRDTRRDLATGVRHCADSNRMLTAYGPVIAAEAPGILEAVRQAVHRETRTGYTGDGAAVPTASLPAGCAVPREHVWLGAQLR